MPPLPPPRFSGARTTRSMARRAPSSTPLTANSSSSIPHPPPTSVPSAPTPACASTSSVAASADVAFTAATGANVAAEPTEAQGPTTTAGPAIRRRRSSPRLSSTSTNQAQVKARIQAALSASASAGSWRPSRAGSSRGSSRAASRAASEAPVDRPAGISADVTMGPGVLDAPPVLSPSMAASGSVTPVKGAATMDGLTPSSPLTPLPLELSPAALSHLPRIPHRTDSTNSTSSTTTTTTGRRRIGTRRNPVAGTPARPWAELEEGQDEPQAGASAVVVAEIVASAVAVPAAMEPIAETPAGRKRKAELGAEGKEAKRTKINAAASTLAFTSPANPPCLQLPMGMDVELEQPMPTTPSMDVDIGDLTCSTTPRVSPPAGPSTTRPSGPIPAAVVPVTTTPPGSPPASSVPTLPTVVSTATVATAAAAPMPPPVTPKSRTMRSRGIKLPTPARDILRAGATIADAAVAAVIPRPPTPPRIADRTPANGYPPLSTASTPATPTTPRNSFAARMCASAAALQANHLTRSPTQRPPLPPLRIPFPPLDTGPRRSLPGEDDPFFVRRPPPMPSPGSRPPMPPPPMICVFDPDEVVVDRVACGEEEAGDVAVEDIAMEGIVMDGVVEPVEEKVEVALETVPAETASVVAPEPASEPTSSAPADFQSTEDVQPQLMDVDVDAPNEPQASSSPPAHAASEPAISATAMVRRASTPVTESASSAPSSPTGPPRLFAGGLPLRRPSVPARPTGLGISRPGTGPSVLLLGDTMRKASYPASLGSGPLRHQTARVVSNPVPPPSMQADPADAEEPPSPRSVSEPTRGATANVHTPPPPARTPPPSRPPSSMSTSMSSRHEDTSRNLASISNVLARLKKKPAETRTTVVRRAPASAPAVLQDDGERPRKTAAANRLAKSTSSRPRLGTLGERNTNTGTLSDMMNAASGTFLKGVVAYVDVYTGEGDEAGSPFAEVLKRCGAKVLVKKPTETCTHIIYKSGRPSTANFVRRLDAEKRPKVVGIKWVKRCAELRSWVNEDEFAVNLDNEDVFVPKKKSMQPKAMRGGLGGLGGGALGGGGLGGLGGGATTSGLPPKLPVRPVPRTNIYAPKVGSPLKKSYVHQDE